MADGHTHTRMTLLHGAYFSSVLYLCNFHSVPAFAAGFVYQIFASPDRDLNGSVGEYYLRKYTGFLHIYWQILWYPYAICMKHRGKSHAIYGTIVRLLYLLSPFIITMPQLSDNSPPVRILLNCLIAQFLCIPIQIMIGFFISYYGVGAFCLFVTGVFVGDLLHLLFDNYIYKG